MKLTKIIQHFDNTHIPSAEIEACVAQEFDNSGVVIGPGSQIAIAAGSRGIANIALIVKATVAAVKERGGEPFIIPAMGSHGGASAEGQRQVLEHYGITEEYAGAPVKSSMEVVELPQEGLKNKVYMDKFAYEADGTIVINRIKPHTDYHGPIESGLMKMLTIGMGNHQGALEIHQFGIQGLREHIPPTARQIIMHGKVLMGLGILENAYDRTARIKALPAPEIERGEMELLNLAKALMPSLPVTQLDVLVVEEFGKNISGTGLDPNIIGRTKIRGEREPEEPQITSIMLLDLTECSHGNGLGIGLADVITRKVFEKIDFDVMYENVYTSSFLERGFIPIIANDEKAGLDFCLRHCGLPDRSNPSVIRIKNTLELDEMWVSQKVLEEVRHLDSIEVTDETQFFLNNNTCLTIYDD